jgi:hypothetical protein
MDQVRRREFVRLDGTRNWGKDCGQDRGNMGSVVQERRHHRSVFKGEDVDPMPTSTVQQELCP